MRSFDVAGRSPVYATEGMAATSHPMGTATALAILREGGNAVDAAISAAATLAVVEPQMTGIGGDCFAIVCEPDGSIHALNGSGRSAKDAHSEWYVEQGFVAIEASSPHSVTVPGAVHGWETLHRRFGTMDFTRLFADAVRYAREGYVVHPRVAHDWANLAGKLAGNAGSARHLLIDGKPPVAGQIMAFPELAETLELIARRGADAFYHGAIASEISETVRGLGGFLSEDDLACMEAEWFEPISAEFCGHEIIELPPSCQGITALILMQLLQREGFANNPTGGERYYQEVELGRIAYAVRDAYVADPATMKIDTQTLLNDVYIADLHRNYDPLARNSSIRLPETKGSDTVYLSVVDRDRRCVSFINSLFAGFGSGITTEKSGIVLQNRGSGFSIRPDHPNMIGPSKQPMHTIIPAMARKDGKPTVCFGVMGGSYQPMGHAHVLTNMLHYGMDPQAALDTGRIFWDENQVVRAEAGIDSQTRAYLRALGYDIEPGGPHGGGQIISIDHENGVLCAGSDPRKDGYAAGY